METLNVMSIATVARHFDSHTKEHTEKSPISVDAVEKVL